MRGTAGLENSGLYGAETVTFLRAPFLKAPRKYH